MRSDEVVPEFSKINKLTYLNNLCGIICRWNSWHELLELPQDRGQAAGNKWNYQGGSDNRSGGKHAMVRESGCHERRS